MKTKTIIRAVLLGFVVVSLGWSIINHSQAPKTRDKSNAPTNTGIPTSDTNSRPISSGDSSESVLPDRVIVYYFHSTYRCTTCYTIEAYTKEAVETGFGQVLRDGRLVFQVVNVEEPAHSHFIKDYQLHTKSVVLVDIRKGRQAQWKNLTKIWELVQDKEAFLKYIQDEINFYLQGK